MTSERVTGSALLDAVKRKAAQQSVELVTVLAPVSSPQAVASLRLTLVASLVVVLILLYTGWLVC
jgi:ABC-type sulfate transport system permease component